MDSSERWLARTFVEFADTLVDDFDVADLHLIFTQRCAALLGAAEVGLMLTDSTGNLQMTSSSAQCPPMSEFHELQAHEGPCLDCFATGRQLRNASLSASVNTWPHFAPIAIEAGMRVAHAVPMRLRQQVIGAVGVFHADERVVGDDEFDLAQALADAATIAILQSRSIQNATQTAEQLQRALDSRIVIEQAKGVIGERLNLTMDESFVLLRSYARDNNQRLAVVAKRVTNLPRPMKGDLVAELKWMDRKVF